MHIQRDDDGPVTILHFSEEEQLRSPESLQSYFSELVEENRVRIIIDLENVSYVSSAVLGVLITLCKDFKDRGGAVKLLNAQPTVSNVLRMTRLDRLFEMYNDLSTAKQSFA
ncbi:MAG: anti-sigma factor antagonist [bacterium]|nr:anti-sigma factor antagonist [bacterium]